jgi:predicted ATPase
VFLDRITLKNVRGFEELDFSLDRGNQQYAGWTVFTGNNGSGKSTLLKAIAVVLTGKESARALEPSFNKWVREGAHEASVEVEVVRDRTDDTFVASGKTPAEDRFPARIALKNGTRETAITVGTPPGKPKKGRYLTPERSIWAPAAHGWFSCGYGPFRRISGASPEAMRQMVAPATERFVTMFQEAASLAEVDQWLRDLKHKELEKKTDESAQLDVLIKILRDDLMPNQITVDRVDSDGLWLKDRNGLSLAWREMSDGYRAALALLADILRHLIKSYGIDGLTEQDSDGKLFVRRSGVVLIDEIDAHLHPEWQRNIGFWLKSHFPNIQFLVTTHSPLICQAADPNGIFVLPEPGSSKKPYPLSADDYRKVIASRPDTILLTPAFGLRNTRSPRAVEGRAEYSKLMSKKRAGAQLTREEQRTLGQGSLFAFSDEEQ